MASRQERETASARTRRALAMAAAREGDTYPYEEDHKMTQAQAGRKYREISERKKKPSKGTGQLPLIIFALVTLISIPIWKKKVIDGSSSL